MGAGDRSAKDAWVHKVLGLDVGAAAPDAQEQQPGSGLEGWMQARGEVIQVLRQLEAAIRAMGDPLGNQAIVLVKSISANLTAAPSDRRQVDELRRYLQSDSVIDDAETPNGFGIEVRIRQPLLGALAAMEQGLA